MSRRAAEPRWTLPAIFAGRAIRIAVLGPVTGGGLLIARLFGFTYGPRLLRWFFAHCGATFVKLGQILAMRYDLLPAAYCEELSKLLDQVPPGPLEPIVATIERDLGRPLGECFAHFDPEPLAAASIAQVHGATLVDGTRVVVKVMRPGIERRFRIDFLFLRALARLPGTRLLLPNLDLPPAVEELIQLTREELDFRREVRNFEAMHRAMLDAPAEHFTPRVFPTLCGSAVITLERLDGVSARALIAALDGGDRERLAAWAGLGIDPSEVAPRILRSLLIQVLRYRFFNADPHASNLIVLAGGVVGWVDFGIVGWLDEESWREQLRMRLAIADGRIDEAYQRLLATLSVRRSRDISRFESDVKSYLRDWILASHSATASLHEKSAGFFLIRAFGAMRRSHIRVPLGTMRLYRAMVVADIVILKLAPGLDWNAVLRDFLTTETANLGLAALAELFWAGRLAALVQDAAAAPAKIFELLHEHARCPAEADWRERSGLERVAVLLLRWLRVSALLATAAAVAARVLQGRLPSGWRPLALDLSRHWLALAVAGMLAVYLLGRLIRELED